MRLLKDKKPYYGEVPELTGVWATGSTLEECRKNLVDVIEGWIIVRLRRGLPIPGRWRKPVPAKRSHLL